MSRMPPQSLLCVLAALAFSGMNALCITKDMKQEALPRNMAVPIDIRGKQDWREASRMCLWLGFSLGFKVPNSNSVLFTL